MVSDKNTLFLLSRLADAQLALAESMRGITTATPGYPIGPLERLAETLTTIDALLLEIGAATSSGKSNGASKPH
jgi:hypothetical protein